MIYIDDNKKIPLYEQVYNGVKRLIKEGTLKKGTKLKAIRSLAEELDVSNNTVSKAYQLLVDDGYVKAVHGSGYYVRKVIKPKNEGNIAANENVKQDIIYDFDYEPMDSRIFPWSKWRHYLMQAISEEEVERSISYEDKKGSIALREELCGYIFEKRGIRCEPCQMIICAGKQYAMDIILDILPDRYNKVLVETPSLKRIRELFNYAKIDMSEIPVTGGGIDTSQLDRTDCNMLYTTPSHNFPLGYTADLTKRVQIVEWARRNEGYVIEDDFESELFNGEQVIPAIQSLDKSERVIYMHTFSRVLSPSLRCTFIVLPKSLLPAYEKRFRYYYTAIPIHNQNALAAFIRDGHLAKQIKKTNQYNYRKYNKMKQLLENKISGEVEIVDVNSCSHLVLRLPSYIKADKMESYLAENGINCHIVEDFAENNKGSLMVLGFHVIDDENMEPACEKLAKCIKSYISNCT